MKQQNAAEYEGKLTQRRRIKLRLGAPMLTLTMALALAGCSQVPDWANPVEWVDGAADGMGSMFDGIFSDDVGTLPPAPKPVKTAKEVPGADKPFPKLGDTPKAPATLNSATERTKIANNLVADRDNARYTDQDLRAGDLRLAAAPPPPKPMVVSKTKPASMVKQPSTSADTGKLTAIPTIKGTAEKPASPSLPTSPKRMAQVADGSSGLTKVPSIVQRRGGLPPPPTPVTANSRGPIPKIVQRAGDSGALQNLPVTAALPKPPAIAAPATLTPVPPATSAGPTAPGAPVRVASATTPQLVAPQLVAPQLVAPTMQASQTVMPSTPSVQVNLPLGQDQSILAQTFNSSLSAQGSPVVRRPGHIFNAPNAAPIGGQWPTVVPGVVQQAFNASLDGNDRDVQTVAGVLTPVMQAPQMSNEIARATAQGTVRRLPGAPLLIRFRHGSTRLTGTEKKRLSQLANRARQEGKMIYVVGHASQRTGDMDYAKHKLVNFNVSLDRANSVAGELRSRGVAATQIVVEAKGDAEPLYFEFMPDGEAKNRRVEVFVR
ncbi:MAG: OmpA family protein [Rhodospirillaceae bacterium]|jgi:outer membrane protein OmpA-like peptidoglycan-associated protein|nr:OmpA family protein [Rhodospirillaceae bacterium]MBT4689265.1 OmpA family protein [Rhodospirillaceae bacterium]MBT5079338.1 OmpA family protein [Rhodospirillaceae bacterium]MBT5525814.1 OmpA family protein [Rhodospirillaceae bacterium]MBT5880185.1 OmpA family protein [Rhodospirillaceae bacterium]